MRSLILSFVLLFTMSSVANAKFLSLNQIGEASCRVRVSSSAGSGSAIAQDKNYVYVLTNAHVVGSGQNTTCEFFRFGRKTARIPGTVIWKSYKNRTVNDFAIIRIQRSLFGGYPPRIIPLAPYDHQLKQNDYIASAGCPQARWLQLWEGHALSDASRDRVLFTPPPLGGQSGSGVYTVINGNTYLCAVLTWKIERDKGGAIHIGNFLRALRGEVSEDQFNTKVPEHWEHVNQEVATPTKKAYYAEGENGLYYLQIYVNGKWMQGVRLPKGHEGTKIVRWNLPFNIQCPGGRCPPFLSPRRPPFFGGGGPTGPNTPPNIPPVDGSPPNNDGGTPNPYGGILPPNLGSDSWVDMDKVNEYKAAIKKLTEEVDGLSAEKETLTAHIEVLASDLQEKTANIDQLAAEKGAMSNSIEELAAALDQKTGALNELGEDVEILKSSKDMAVDKIEVLSKDISQQLGKIEELQTSLKDRSTALSGLVDEHAALESTAEEVKDQRNIMGWLFGGTVSGVLWCLVSGYWRIRGKDKLLDIVEDKLGYDDNDPVTTPPPTPNYGHSYPKERETWKAEPKCDNKENDLSGLADYLQDKLEGILDNKLGSLNEKISSIEMAATVKEEEKEEEKIPVMSSKSTSKTCSNKTHDDSCSDVIMDFIQQPSFPPASDRIKDFVDLKKSDGERVEELAFYAHLYKEAVELLKNNNLIVINNAEAFKVSSQVKAAEAIEAYVQNQFLQRVSSATLSTHILYHEAMIGFLYKQAIIRLRRGEFNVLGYKEVAAVVEKWVKTEFMKRMGFDF